MPLINKAMGARIFASIGRRGEQPDVYPAKIASPVTITFGPRGPVETATIIEVRTNLAGEEYLNERVANLRYSWDRTELVEKLDGTAQDPKPLQTLFAERAQELEQFLARQAAPQTMNVSDLMAAADDTAAS